MKTSEFIAVLTSADAAPVRPVRPLWPLILFSLIGALLALAVLTSWLGIQPLTAAVHATWFWMKAGYSLSLAAAGLLLLSGLARPGTRLVRGGPVIGGLAMLAIAILAARAALMAPVGQGASLWLGETWRSCSIRIVLLSVPTYLALCVIMRRLAPTRLMLTGAAAGLAAGGVAAAIYGLYCQETAAPFVAVWYSTGVAASTVIGAVLGRRLLRW